MNSFNSMKSTSQNRNSYYGTFARRDQLIPLLFLSGYYSTDITFYDNTNTSVKTLINAGNNDIYVVNYRKDGSITWVVKIAGSGIDNPVNILLDSSNNVYISGTYTQNITLYNSKDTTTSSFKTLTNPESDSSAFIAKYNSNGIGLWVTYFKTSSKFESQNTWTAITSVGIQNWIDVEISSDGKYQIAQANNGYISTSSDYGVNWIARTAPGSRVASKVAISGDGKYQISLAYSQLMYQSSNYGVTWVGNSFFGSTRIWAGAAISYDGKYQTVNMYVTRGGYIHVSSNYGNNWTQKTSIARNWNSVSMSSDGKYQTALYYSINMPGYITTSSDYGNTWIENTGAGSKYWNGISVSSNGKYQTVYVADGYIYISSDYGNSWNEKTGFQTTNWKGISMSSSGMYQIAVAPFYIYLSSNYGQNWIRNTKSTDKSWIGVSMSSTGNYITTGVSNSNYLYISSAISIAPPIKLNLLLDSTNNLYVSFFYTSLSITLYNSDDTIFATFTDAGSAFISKYNNNGNGIWVSRLVGTGSDVPVSLLLDSMDNVYICGYYGSTLTLYNSNNTSFATLTNEGSSDTFIAKYNNNGNGIWVSRLAGTGTDVPVSLLLDSTNNVYICGYYDSTLTLYNSNGTSFKTLSNLGINDTFIAKYDSIGNGNWATRIVDASNNKPVKLLLDSINNLYISGYYDSPLTLYNSTFVNTVSTKTLANSGGNDIYISNYDNDGFINWVTRISGAGNNIEVKMVKDSYNNVYISGYYRGDIIFYNSNDTIFATLPNTNESSTTGDSFIAKYASNGNGMWVTRVSSSFENETVEEMLLDSQNNIYIIVKAYGVSTLYNADTSIFKTLTAKIDYQQQNILNFLIIAKYNSNGFGIWATKLDSIYSYNIGLKYTTKAKLDLQNKLHVSLIHDYTLNIYNENGSEFAYLESVTANDSCLVKYNIDGNVEWKIVVKSGNNDQIISINFDSENNLYIMGESPVMPISLYNRDNSIFATLNASRTNVGINGKYIAKYNSNGFGVWAAKIESGGASISALNINSIVIDNLNNIYIIIFYYATISIYSSSNTLFKKFTVIGNEYDVCIAKYNATGNVVWASRINGNSVEKLTTILLDSTNNVYISGYYGSTLKLYNSDNITFKTLTNAGSNDTFIAKYNNDGNLVWATRIGGTGNDNPVNIILDSTNNVYILGFCSSILTLFDSTDRIFNRLTNLGDNETFIAKYNSSGFGIWATSIPNTSGNESMQMILNSSNNVLISGCYFSDLFLYYNSSGKISFREEELNIKKLTNSGGTETFIAKYDNSGNCVWVTRILDTSNNQPVNLLLDSINNIYISGYYGSTLTLYNSNSSSFKTLTNAEGGSDMFIAKYNSSGNGLWVTYIAGSGSNQQVNLLLDSTNNVYISGYYGSQLTLYNSTDTTFKTLTNDGGNDTFIATYDSSGNGIWANRIADTSNNQPVSMVVKKNL